MTAQWLGSKITYYFHKNMPASLSFYKSEVVETSKFSLEGEDTVWTVITKCYASPEQVKACLDDLEKQLEVEKSHDSSKLIQEIESEIKTLQTS